MENEKVYVTVLHDSLQRKVGLLKQILTLATHQKELLEEKRVDMDRFDASVEQEMNLLQEMQELDQGFENLYGQIGTALKDKKYQYQSQILEMQEAIREISRLGMEIQGLEQQNKQRFQKYLLEQRQEIKRFKMNNKTANTYHQNMSDQHRQWQSYFLDEKK